MSQRWTEADVARVTRGAASPSRSRPSKYRNVKVVVDGQSFDSKAEAAYWHGLVLREKAGEIQGLQRQVHFPLYAPLVDEDGQQRTFDGMVQVSEYIADFVWHEGFSRIVADKKSPATQKKVIYRLKKKWLELQQGIRILEV